MQKEKVTRPQREHKLKNYLNMKAKDNMESSFAMNTIATQELDQSCMQPSP